MHATVNELMQWLHLHPGFGGLIAFAISFLESVAIIGTMIPGSVLMTATGALIGTGVLPVLPIFLSAIFGAVIGDTLSYYIGSRFKGRLHEIWIFKKFPNLVTKGEMFFHKHGGKSIFLGRFTGPIRAITPLIAGSLGFKFRRFLTADIISGILWAPGFMIPGIILGAASLELPPDIAIYFILILLAIIALFLVAVWLIKIFYVSVSNFTNRKLAQLWKFLISKPKLHWLCRLLKYHDETQRGQLSRALALVILSILLVILVISVMTHTGIWRLDYPIHHFFSSIRTPYLDDIMAFIALFGQKEVVLPLAVTVAIWLVIRKNYTAAIHWFIFGIVTAGTIVILKFVTHSPRPFGIMHQATNGSFPSGHVTISTAFYGFITYSLAKRFNIKQAFFYIPAAILVTLIAISRLYLQAHWLTDVIGGMLVGLILLQLVIFSYRRLTIPQVKPFGLAVVTVLTLAVFGWHYANRNFEEMIANSQPVPRAIVPIDQGAWWKNDNSQLPKQRKDRFGQPVQSFDIEWAGDLPNIKKSLHDQGWEDMQRLHWSDLIHPVSIIKRSSHLTVFSKLFENKQPVLIMIKHFANHAPIILRLWQTNFKTKKTNLVVYVGTLQHNIPIREWFRKHHKHPQNEAQNMKIEFKKQLSQFDSKLNNRVLMVKPKSTITGAAHAKHSHSIFSFLF